MLPGARRALLQDPLAAWAGWVAAGLLVLLLVGYGLDHRVARFVHEQESFSRNARRLVHIPEIVVVGGLLGALAAGLQSAFVAPVKGVWRDVLLAAVSLCVALTVTSVLKVWFGRIPPERWYAAQWHNFFAFLPGSFPSGHMTVMSAIAPFLWARSRLLGLLLVLAGLCACYGLVMQQAHFLSDLVGGVLVGASVGYTVRLAGAKS